MNLNKLKIIVLLSSVVFLASCSSTKDIRYFQNAENGKTTAVSHPIAIKVKAGDKLSIVVNSKNPELAALYNLPIQSVRLGSGGVISGNSQSVSVYTVDSEGNIDFPVLGKINVLDKTRSEIADIVKQALISNQLVNDPVVIVEYSEMYVSMLGEIAHPGRYTINKDNVTVLDAIGMAGDLTIYGKRDSIQVLRTTDAGQTMYVVNITNLDSLLSSPAYYLQQNDVVYVQPNATRERQSTVNGNNIRSTSFWISLGSFLITALNFVIVVLNK
ncbi:MAG: polysaccharide biosynthesis/export family protein [Bacteroidales bacterium]|nr:polysaccharide biosynthesis/export family protein [Bacteroidales bacterium]